MQREPVHWLKCVDHAIRAPRHAMLPPWKRRALGLVRLVIVLFRDLVAGELTDARPLRK